MKTWCVLDGLAAMAARNASSDVFWLERGVCHAGISDTPVISEKCISRDTEIVKVMKKKLMHTADFRTVEVPYDVIMS
jgi:hypothetical protein